MPISTTLPATLQSAFTISMWSPSPYGRSSVSITPRAKSWSSPCRARPIASVHVANMVSTEPVWMPTTEATHSRSTMRRPLPIKLMPKFRSVGSMARPFSWAVSTEEELQSEREPSTFSSPDASPAPKAVETSGTRTDFSRRSRARTKQPTAHQPTRASVPAKSTRGSTWVTTCRAAASTICTVSPRSNAPSAVSLAAAAPA
mmetsp:Transcript_1725/g.5311  ORF Transcript_1725/g.5311 Transcript_1725/m.5311 type:complete len:202 (+) Transcript_1725:486-1091(+)